jgi:hypothetical protein
LEDWGIDEGGCCGVVVATANMEGGGMITAKLDELELMDGWAEEIVLILEGAAEAVVGDERGRLSAGEIALIPEMVPHDIYNVGEGTLKVLSFFAAPMVISTFDEPVMPINERVVGTPPPEMYEAAEDTGS